MDEPFTDRPEAAPPGARFVPSAPPGVVCRSCGYELTGLRADAVCPECATPIRQSLRRDLLVFSDADWLLRLRRGSALVVWTTLAWIGLHLLGRMLASIITTRWGQASGVTESVFILCNVCLSAWFVLSVWHLTTPERADGAMRGAVSAKAARALVTVGVLTHNAHLLMAAPLAGVSPDAVGWIGIGLAALGWVALLFYASTLARRMGRLSFASAACAAAWIGLLATLTTAVLWLGSLAAAQIGTGPGRGLLAAFSCLGVVVIPITWFVAIAMIALLAHALEGAHVTARSIQGLDRRR